MEQQVTTIPQRKLSPIELLLEAKSRGISEHHAKSFEISLLQSYQELPVRRVEDIVALPVKNTIGLVKREFGQTHLRALLTLIINDLLDFLNVGKTMGGQQIAQTIMMIEQEYYYLTLEDFKICFDTGKRGDYGQLYDRIDGQIILDWLARYAEDRSMAFANHNDLLSVNHKERSDRAEQRAFDDVLKQLKISLKTYKPF